MECIEEGVSSTRMFAVMAHVCQVVHDVSSSPSTIMVEPEFSGEIIIKVKDEPVAMAKRQFMNKQAWDINVDERIQGLVRSPKIF